MNHDDDTQRFDSEPVPIGGALHDVEDRVRLALETDAGSIQPTQRLDAILAAAHSDEPMRFLDEPRRRRPWVVLGSVAAAAAVVAGTLWVAGRPDAPTPALPTDTQTSSALSTSPGPSPTTGSPRPTDSATQSGPTAAPTWVGTTLPVYFLGEQAPGSPNLRLFREFHRLDVLAPVDDAGRVEAALQAVMGEVPEVSRYVSLWRGVEVGDVTVEPQAITIPLSKGLVGTGGEATKLAVQQLVWTAQAAAGEGRLPVRFELAAGEEVAPGLSAEVPYNVPTGLDQFDEIATIWIDAPSNGARLESGTGITVKGLASVFEANVEWQLLEDGTELDKGFTTASAGAPARGTYTFSLPNLTPGTYTVRVFESSMEDGSVATEARATFTVQ